MDIGLEIHVQLDLNSKAFASESFGFTPDANSSISSVSLALPGSLPVLNERHLQSALKLGAALSCELSDEFYFDRKHYFYPDSPKGYQITQDHLPYCKGGRIQYFLEGEKREIALHHIHMEDDAGKSIHDRDNHSSLIDFNRAGSALVEIVTMPELHRPEEVSACIDAIQQLVQYLDISAADMEKGMLRCDCNVSLRPIGQEELGNRCEIKNLNSKRFARRAILVEIERQVGILDAGGVVDTQTMSYDATLDNNTPIRDKETVHDYRYFPDPDLPLMQLKEEDIENIKSSIGKLPGDYFTLFSEKNGLAFEDAMLCISSRNEAHFISDYFTWHSDNKLLANIYIQKIRPWLVESGREFDFLYQKKESLLSYVKLILDKKISPSEGLNSLLPIILQSQVENVEAKAQELSLILENDDEATSQLVEQILTEFPDKVKAYQNGKKGLIGFFMGEYMRKSTTKADPKIIQKLLAKFLEQ